MLYLVDTDWTIDYLRVVKRVVRRLDEFGPEGPALSYISLAELYEGILGSARSQQRDAELQAFLSRVQLLPLDDDTCRAFGDTCRAFGQLRASLRSSGNLIADMDLPIASTALNHELTLLTNNRRHFPAYPRTGDNPRLALAHFGQAAFKPAYPASADGGVGIEAH